ncbi:MAG: hypothetical protein ACYTGX_13955 [Planctomycetota bacterium]
MTPSFANIGPKGKRFRTVMGVVSFWLGVGVVVTAIALGYPWWVRLTSFILFYFGLFGILQARSSC